MAPIKIISSDIAWEHSSDQRPLSSGLLPTNVKSTIYITVNFARCIVRTWNLVCHVSSGTLNLGEESFNFAALNKHLLCQEFFHYFFVLQSLQSVLTSMGPCIVIYFYSKTNQMHNFRVYWISLYMFRTVFQSIIRSQGLYVQRQVYVILVSWLLPSRHEMETVPSRAR